MTEASVSFAGNLTDQPELRHTDGGIARAMFRVAVSGRREQEASFFTGVVWRDQAEHAAASLSKGSRVVVVGRLQQRSWTTEDGSARQTVEVVAEELGPEPALGDGDHDQGDEEPGAAASSTDDAMGRDAGGHARVPPRQVRRRCLRWSRIPHHQGLAIAASLAMRRAGVMRTTWRSEAEQHPRRGSPPAPPQESAAAPPRAPRRTWPQTRSHRR
jgi:single-strand DNA-binding protein